MLYIEDSGMYHHVGFLQIGSHMHARMHARMYTHTRAHTHTHTYTMYILYATQPICQWLPIPSYGMVTFIIE